MSTTFYGRLALKAWVLWGVLMFAIAMPGDVRAADETPNCGGNGQNACWFTKAKRHKSLACKRGQFFDLLTGSCWSCPSGYNRSILPIKGNQACHKPSSLKHKNASYVRKGTACDPKRLEFFDLPTWSCWSCGRGYDRTAWPIKGGKACVEKLGGKYARAKYHSNMQCGPGQFFDIRNGGECWSCPSGYNRHITPITGGDACIPRRFCDAGLMQYNVHKPAGDDGLRTERYAKCAKRGACGKKGQRPCYVWERLPSCNAGLYEDFESNTCEKLKPGEFPFFAGMASFSREAANTKEFCKKAIYNIPFWKDAQKWVDTEQNLAIKAMKADLNCRKDFQIGFLCQSADILGLATAPAGIVNEIMAAGNRPPCSESLKILTTKASVVKGKEKGANLFDGCPEGAFWDPIDGGSCWRCPAEYKRHITHVKGKDACIKASGYPQLLRGHCAIQHGLWGNTGSSLQCISKLIGSGRFGDVKALFKSGHVRPWNTPCTKAGAFAFDAAVAVVTGGGSAAASGAKAGTSGIKAAVNAIKGLYAKITTKHASLTALDRVRTVNKALTYMKTIKECQPYQAGVEEAIAADPELNGSQVAAVATAKPSVKPIKSMKAGGKWRRVKVDAFDIGVGADGTVFRIGVRDSIHKWQPKTQKWQRFKGALKRVDVGPKGNPWGVNAKGEIYRHDGRKWHRMQGKASDIGVGGNGKVWVIGADDGKHGASIHRLEGRTWKKMPGAATRIDVDPKGNAWVVNKQGRIYRYSGKKWESMPGQARDIAIGGDGSILALGVDGRPYRWVNKKWRKMDGFGTEISVGPKGRPWIVSAKNELFAWDGAEK